MSSCLAPWRAALYAYGAATKALAGNEMAELGLMAEAGAVGFTNCTSSIHDSLVMRRLLAGSNMLDKPFIQHCEDHALTSEGEMNEGGDIYSARPDWQPG